LQEILDRPLEPLGDDLQVPAGRMSTAQLDLAEEGPTEVLLGNGGEAQAQLHPDLADTSAKLLRGPKTAPGDPTS